MFQIAYGYGLFTGGLGAHAGAERIGASVIPISSGNTEKQIQLMTDFGTTALCCTPSYALYLAEMIDKMGVGNKLKLKAGFFGAEPWTEGMRKELENKLSIKAFDIFGLTEIIGPGVAYNCSEQNGLHFNEDHFIPEIIDPNTLQPLPAGEVGELVITTITKEGMPILRYRTKDLTSLNYEKMFLRKNFGAYGQNPWTQRRYVDYSWDQCLSLAGGKRFIGIFRSSSSLSPFCRPDQ